MTMPPTSIFPFIYSLLTIFCTLAMIPGTALISPQWLSWAVGVVLWLNWLDSMLDEPHFLAFWEFGLVLLWSLYSLKPSSLAKWKRLKRPGVMLLFLSVGPAKGGMDRSKPLAGQVIDGAYGYQYGPVAFKPTWANGETTFCKTRAEQFHISSKITQPLTILASRLEPHFPFVALGWSVD